MELEAPEDLDGYVKALKALCAESGLTMREITHVTGSETGILAAKEVGIIPAGVTWGDADAQRMLMAGASYVLSNEEDLRLCLDFL